ncbi:hypothetical protein OROHE_018038 [Orobanche hederae]
MRSDTRLAEAVKLLARHKVLSAPVLDVNAPEDASWIDRYIGVVEFTGIIVWILHQMYGDDIGPAVAASWLVECHLPGLKAGTPTLPLLPVGNFLRLLLRLTCTKIQRWAIYQELFGGLRSWLCRKQTLFLNIFGLNIQ